MKGRNTLFSHKSDEWETPDDLYQKLDSEFNFTLDPCATELNKKCEKFYTPEQNGLLQSWEGETVFINPPFSKIKRWVEKAYVESKIFGVTCVMLLPARTDTWWFHTYIYDVPDVEIRFIRRRLKFKGVTKTVVDFNFDVLDEHGEPTAEYKEVPINDSAPFPSMIVIFRKKIG